MILLPAHNEAPRIARVVGEVRDIMPHAEVVVVDDGSTDGTGDRAFEAGATVLPHPINLGYGSALQTGYKYAFRKEYPYLAQLDADGQHDPAGLPALLSRVREDRCDLCIGSRFLEGSTYAIPPARRVGMWVFRRVASTLTGLTITDPTSGFQAMNQRVVAFFTRDHYPTDYPDTDLLVLVHRHAFRIAEAPVIMRAAESSQSIHQGARPLYYLFKMALDIPLNLIRKERP